MFYTTKQVGIMFGLTAQAVIYWEENNILKCSFRRGNRRMYSKVDIIDYANTLSKRRVIDIDEKFKFIYEE
jgi:DNA-binding transcriptional MerR regulator